MVSTDSNVSVNKKSDTNLFKWAKWLAWITIVYNIGEGLIAMYFGWEEETLALFGFGADSFVETISAFGVLQMIFRIEKNPNSSRGTFEIRALRITAYCFFVLAVLLTVSAVWNTYLGQEPESTLPGFIVGAVSILTMWALIRAKIYIGTKLNSAPIIADARCNQVCLYMSVVLLISSGLYLFFQVPYVDALGTLFIVYFCITEGREALDKAKGIECSCEDEGH